MAFQSKVKHKVLTGQTRELISSLIKFMTKEAELGAPLIPFAKVQERVAAATGVSIRTIRRIKSESKKIEKGEMASFATPNRKRNSRTSRVSLDDFDRSELRRIITNFHIEEKTIPSVKKIHEEFGYRGSNMTLQKEIHKLGFSWRKVKNSRRILMERHEIRHMRIEFLRKIHEYREEGRPIIYIDENNIHSSHTHRNIEGNEGLKKSTSEGTCLIIINAGGKDGIPQNVYVKWKSNTDSDDYKKNNFKNYLTWVAEELIPDLPERSVVVINDNPFHNKQVDKIPSSAWNKDDMQQWLRSKDIPFHENMLKPELYEIIKIHKPTRKQYIIDEIFNANGHDVLRLPPYHPDLNPVELVWAAMKEYLAKQNVKFSFQNVTNYCDRFFEQFTAKDWNAKCEQAEIFQKKFMMQESLIDTIVDNFTIDMNEESDIDIDSDTESEGELDLNYDMMECDQSDNGS